MFEAGPRQVKLKVSNTLLLIFLILFKKFRTQFRIEHDLEQNKMISLEKSYAI